MADFIKIQLIQGADENGDGGTVLDSPTVKMPDGHLDIILASYAAIYGLDRTKADGTTETLTLARNYTYRLREYGSEVVKAAAVAAAKLQAESQAGDEANAAIGAVEVVE
jgi:hypothetical protein